MFEKIQSIFCEQEIESLRIEYDNFQVKLFLKFCRFNTIFNITNAHFSAN